MKTKLFIAAMAAVAVIGCQKEVGSVTPDTGDYNTSFLSVSLKSAGAMTKAPETAFEYGLEAENNVATVNFYFFDAAGAAYTLYGANGNWLAVNTNELPEADKTGTTTEGTDIEAYTDVILVLKSRQVTPPSKVVALINVANGANYKDKSLSELTALANSALTVDEKGFVMSNSVYEDGSIVKATEITAENIFTSPDPTTDDEGNVLTEDSLLDQIGGTIKPVEIYVERVAAKVRVNSDAAAEATGLIQVTPTEASPLPATLDEAYVKVLGWQVTNTVATSYLIKDVKATDLFTPWNNAAFFRSYWANTHGDAEAIHRLTFNDIAPADGALTLGGYSYYHENTLDPEVENIYNNVDVNGEDEEQAAQAPQLIIAGQLVDASGKALDIAKWYGTYYTEEGVKTAMINTVAAKIYVEDTEKSTETQKAYRSIGINDVTWYQVAADTQYGATSDENHTGNRRYEVKVKATDKTTYYDATGTELTTANALLDGIQAAQIWKNGYTYYYTTIDHFGTTAMVRNHLYDVNIQAINGLGTPVYDPTHVITPEIPVDQEAYHLTAQINILTWHLVAQNVTLGF